MTEIASNLAAIWPGFAHAIEAYPFAVWTLLWLLWAGICMGFVSVYAMLIIWVERRVAGRIQARIGPNRVGPQGLLQSVADGIKLLTKEDLVPITANRFLFTLAPPVVFVGTFIPFVALPFSRHGYGAAMDIGVFFIASFMALEVIGVIMAGWASNSKWSLYGAMRMASQMMSYEIPLGITLACVVVFAGSLNIVEIVEQQGAIPNVVRSPFLALAFVIFYVAALASSKRAPFDLPEAESELVAGFHTEYSGMRFSFFFLAEYAAMYVLCALGALLFLGGWYGPIPMFWVDLLLNDAMLGGLFGPGSFGNEAIKNVIGLHNLLIKAGILLLLMIQIRWTLPRVRIDQTMSLCWKVLLPFSLLCFLGAAVQGVVVQILSH